MENTIKRILIVDDVLENLQFMHRLLCKDYKVSVASSGKAALSFVKGGNIPDIILLDVMMPELNGYEVCLLMRAIPQILHIPIIFLTSKNGTEDEKKGFEVGGSDFISKPVNPDVLRARVNAHIAAKNHADFMSSKAEYLEAEVSRRVRELGVIQDVTIQVMASLAETRDNETGAHIRRTQLYIKALSKNLRKNAKYQDVLSDSVIETYFKSAPLHDIGKVGIPDHILLKAGRLEVHEFEVMKTHTTLGRNAIQKAEDVLGVEIEFLNAAKDIAYCHQEKWDGSGYPQGLKHEQIPLSARLMAVADVYDALISKRVYKPAMSHEKAASIILEGQGTHFDPDVVAAFIEVMDDFKLISEEYQD